MATLMATLPPSAHRYRLICPEILPGFVVVLHVPVNPEAVDQGVVPMAAVCNQHHGKITKQVHGENTLGFTLPGPRPRDLVEATVEGACI